MIETVVDLTGHRVTLRRRELRIHRHVHLGAQPVTHPPRPHLRHIRHAFHKARGVPDFVYYLRVHPVEQAGEDHLARLPHDHQDSSGDQEPYYGVSKWEAEPHSDSSDKDSKACPAVGDERGAAYLPAHPDAEDRHRLVAHETLQSPLHQALPGILRAGG